MSETLCASVLAKIDEQMERTMHLIELLPPNEVEKVTLEGSWTASMLLGHLLDCMAGFCAVLAAFRPEPRLDALRGLPVNHACGPEEALARIALYRTHIAHGFAAITDSDLARVVPTVFTATGETLLTLFLGNLEHLINHKHQLFVLLQALGCPVASSDLYRFRT
jgi:uncharacterized damage-inducible protein DinB